MGDVIKFRRPGDWKDPVNYVVVSVTLPGVVRNINITGEIILEGDPVTADMIEPIKADVLEFKRKG